MWTCAKCGNDNEDNFKFCWNCGKTKAERPVSAEASPVSENPVFNRETSQPEPAKPFSPAPRETEKTVSRPAAPQRAEQAAVLAPKTVAAKNKAVDVDDDDDVLPMFARVTGSEHHVAESAKDSSLENKIFTAAVRLLGLYFVYLFINALPDLALMVYAALTSETNENAVAELFTGIFIIPLAKALFYLIVGIYLIASGRLLLRLLPGR